MSRPLSPVLVVGLALRPVPPSLVQPLLGMAMRAMRSRHPAMFERLAELAGCVFLIDPSDLPFRFALKLDGATPRLICLGDRCIVDVPTATIRGPFLTLIELLEGRLDGDAMFFSRDLTIEGDTASVLTLRNAIDSAEIGLADDLISPLGPFKEPARRVLNLAVSAFRRAAADLETLEAAIVCPVTNRLDAEAAHIVEMEEQLAMLRRQVRRLDAWSHRTGEMEPSDR